MSIDKKWKKFKRNPKIFFSDMYQKRRNNILKYIPKRRYKTEQVFTVISAVYGVEKYLNDYFKSLVNQTIGFKSHIHLILVDDDSPDNSAKIIHEWIEKYPDNITYIHKENGGQASARNLGMDFAKTKWVSFIDPDDFVCLNYFEEIAKTIDNNPNLGIINCNLVFFHEKSRQYSDTHALKYKFQNGVIYTSGSNLEKNIIMSASSSVFDLKIIINNGLLFHKKVKPTFEDARFISEYLFYTQSLQVAFIPNAKYYYRKRADESSTIDKSWQDTRKYLDIFEYGYIFILEFYHDKMQGKVPEFIQRQVLYDLSWYCKYLLNNPSPLEILDEEQKKKFYQNVKKTFRYISRKVILEFELAGVWLFFKIGMLGAFKNDDSFKQTAYIERFDQAKQEILISYNSFEDSVISVIFDDEDTIPRYIKQKRHTFAAEYFVTTNKMWIKLPDHFNNFQIIINGILSRISLSGQVFNKLTRESLFTNLKNLLPENQDEHWILMDRDIQADDNAEHLYRYINKNHPEQKIYYVLSKDSHDWNRLKADNFKLLDFNSAQHKFLLKRASKIISSHAEKHIHNFFSDNSMIKQQFVFLQHGVISQDLSTWLNGKPNIDLMITSTKAEKDSITFNQQYYLTAKEVVLTGLARHDSLFFKHKKFSSNDKIILIMPTWRNYILPATKLGQFKRDINSNFMLTQYAIYWQSFLKNSRLKEISNKNIKIIFAPHKNIEPYLDNFELPAYIETWKSQDESIQNLFLKSSLLVTDYSSVAFDMAFLEKQVIYYQFDEDEFYSGKHTYTKGYFDFRTDGFGPVVTKENELIEAIDKIVRNGFIIEQPYISRIKNLYPFRDGRCCERIFQAIKNLDKPSTNKFVDLEILKRFMLMSSYHRDWNSAIERSKRILLLGNNKHKNIAYQILAEASYHQYQPSIFFDNADVNFEQIKDNKTKALILMACEKWEEAYSYWDTAINKQEVDYYYQLMCYQHIYHQGHKLAINISDLEKLTENKSVLYLFKALIYNSQQNLEDAIKQLNLCLTYNTSSLFLKRYQPQLLLADIYRRIGELDKCDSQLIDFEKHTRNNTQCRIQIAKLALKKRNYVKAINQLKSAFSDNYLSEIPISMLSSFTYSICSNHEWNLVMDCAQQLLLGDNKHKNIAYQILAEASYHQYQPSIFFDNADVNFEQIKDNKTKALILMACEKWEEAYSYWDTAINKQEVDYYYQLMCYQHIYHQGHKLAINISDLEKLTENKSVLYLFKALIYNSQQNLEDAIKQLNLCLTYNTSSLFLKRYQPQLLLADIYRRIGELDKCHSQLIDFEKHTRNNTQCRIQIAKLALKTKNYSKVIKQLDQAFNNNFRMMPLSILDIYFKASKETLANEQLDKLH